MKEKNPLEIITEQLVALFQTVQNIEKKPVAETFPPDIIQKLQKLRGDIDKLDAINKKREKDSVIKVANIPQSQKKTSKDTPYKRNIEDKLQKMKIQAEDLRLRLLEGLQKQTALDMESKKKLARKPSPEEQSKGKEIGVKKLKGFGRKGWKKL